MLHSKLWGWASLPQIRAHLCTLAVSMSFNATWRVARDGARFGGLAYGVVLTAALVVVALPVTLLQLAIGQLSQQDAVGVWRAVPFFRGVGYIRLLVSIVGSAYSIIYLALTIAYFLYTATHSIPFTDCVEWVAISEEEYVNVMNASECLSNTFMSPVSESPEYYLAIALIVAVLWIASPFVFYSSVKLMKRIMYLVAPLIIILGIVIVACIGESSALTSLKVINWHQFTEPHVWNGALVQALWSCQIAGGYLIAAGDSVYSNTNVQWTSIAITCASILSSWFWLLFWYAITGLGYKDTSAAAVLVQMYQAADERELDLPWPVLVYLTLILSGVITMIVLLYPIYDRLRRVGGIKWRLAAFASSVVCAGVSLAILTGGLPVLNLIEDLAVPLLICMATVLEILAFGLVYGWKNLIEDVEFLIGAELIRYWVWGWWAAPPIIALFATWGLTILFLGHSWVDPQEAVTVIAAVTLAAVVFIICAVIAVGRQIQYGIFEKLQSSFHPTRHWGPRDPITHYYWLASRENVDRDNVPRTRYNRRELGQLSRRPSFLTVTDSIPSKDGPFSDIKHRSNSDDWLYTSGRKKHLTEIHQFKEMKRSKSLDWDLPIRKRLELRLYKETELAKEDNNNIVGFKYNDIV